MRVKRGKDWDYEYDGTNDYHYSIPGYGYIENCKLSTDNMASVLWDSQISWGQCKTYRIGKDNKYDLFYVKNQGR